MGHDYPILGSQYEVLTERSLLVPCAALGVLQAWLCRYVMNPDGISYLDIGDAYLRGDWKAAINAYWSPMYSWIVGFALHLLKPSVPQEFPIVHLVNLMVYFVALYSFRFFLHAVLRATRRTSAGGSDEFSPLPHWLFLALGYSLFLWSSLVLIDVGEVTPDLLVAAIVFLIGGLLLDLRTDESYGKFAIFGMLNGAAYLSKGIMFPLGFGFLAILFCSGKRTRSRITGVLLAAFVFVAVCTPFIAALSKAKGRFTFGDTGKQAYARLVSPGVPETNWQGEPPGSGTPLHPTKKLQNHPPVFEFGEPISGTYPPWFDPSYWNDGAQWRFRFRSQLRVLIQSAFTYGAMLSAQYGLLAGVLVFLLVGGKPTLKAIGSNWPLLAAACLSMGVYSLVLVKTRYVGASAVFLWIAVFAGVRVPKQRNLESASKYLVMAVVVTILMSVTGHLVTTAYDTLTVGRGPLQREQVDAALGLESMGLRAGDRVAVIGDGVTDYWAHLGRFKVVSQIASVDPGHSEFWTSSPETRISVYKTVSGTGARAVIVWDPPLGALESGWKQIPNSRYFAYFFPK